MASFFPLHASSSFILLLQLLSLTAGDLFLRGHAAALGDVCAQTREPSRCIDLLSSSDSRSAAAALPELAQIAITADRRLVGTFQVEIQNLKYSATDPKLKALYQKCETLYTYGMSKLVRAPVFLKERAYSKIIGAAGVVSSSVSGCAAAVADNPTLKEHNEDAGLLADAVAVTATKLSA